MYLSRIEPDISRRDTKRMLVSPQVLHAAVENCFPNEPNNNARKLWRLDTFSEKRYLLVLSHDIPNFTKFSEQFCAEGRSGETRAYESFLSRIAEGQIWRFRLRANPVHSVSEKEGARGKVYAHETIAQQKGWLMKKALSCGFDLDEPQFDVIHKEHLKFQRGKSSVSLGVAVFEGVLKVSDKQLFIQSLTAGIGRAKAYGCGLLTVMKQ